MSSSLFSFTTLTLVLRTLFIGSPTGSLWFTTIIWAARLVTLSLLFRTFLGPSILRLVSRRLKVRSVSLRSIRGIYYRSSSGIWRIDRIGLSYHRRSGQGSSRFAVKVEGVNLEIQQAAEHGRRTSPGYPRSSTAPIPTPTTSHHGFTTVLRAIYDYVYWTFDPYVRPVVRSMFVTVFRLLIRALPTLVQALDFELESAVIAFSSDVDAKLSIARAKVDMNVALEQLGALQASEKPTAQLARHKRFASVANLNTRLKSSMKRTWDRAWGGTEVAASVALNVSQILVTTRDPTRDEHNTSIAGMCINLSVDSVLMYPIERLYEMQCLDVPHVTFSVAARFNPRKGILQHSLETSLQVEPITIDLDALLPILNILKKQNSGTDSADKFPQSPISPTPTPASAIPPTPPSSAARSTSPPPISPRSIFKRPTSPSPSLSSLTSWRSSISVSNTYVKTVIEILTFYRRVSNSVGRLTYSLFAKFVATKSP